jgi:hypothetical protein
MTMVSTGPISLGGTGTSGGLNQSVNVELGRSGTATINMNESAVRTLAGVASGAISMNNFYGKSNAFTFNRTISSNTQNYNLLSDMVANGYTNGSAFTANITVNSGVYVWSDSTSLAGFDTGSITGTGTINIVNNGFIIGKGGIGGGVSSATPNGTATFNVGLPGGPAMNILKPVNVTNNSYIAGGGGGGGTKAFLNGSSVNACLVSGGGGAGGGGVLGVNQNATTFIAGLSTGGTVGTSGSTQAFTAGYGKGGGGGRVLPGTGGTRGIVGSMSGGDGGSANNVGGNGSGTWSVSSAANGSGGGSGGGGGVYATSSKAGNGSIGAGGGGGWGANGGNYFGNTGSGFMLNSGGTAPGGSGGKAINTNANAVTFITTGTVYGAVS